MEIIIFDRNNKKEWNEFIHFGTQQYDSEVYTDSINRIDTHSFLMGFSAKERSAMKARLALFTTGLFSEEKPVLFFGHLEAMDMESGKYIVNQLLIFCKQYYPDYRLIGPVNGSTWSPYRLALDKFLSLFPNDIENKSFYPEMLSGNGLKILYCYGTNLQINLSIKKTMHADNLFVSYPQKSEIVGMMDDIYDISMDAFSRSPLFTMVPRDMFINKYLDQLERLDLKLMPFALDRENKPIGYAVCYPDHDARTLVVKTIARKAGRAYAGVGRLLSEEIVKNAIKYGYEKLYHACIYRENVSNNLSLLFNGELYKNYAVYYKDL